MWSEKDKQFWLEKEEEVQKNLVNLADYGFVVEYRPYTTGWVKEPDCFVRKGVAEALVKAREALPKGYNFKIKDGWRGWDLQQKYAALAREKIIKGHPEWTEEQVDEQMWVMAPPQRYIIKFASHRYGGSVDITVVDDKGEELNMGVPMGHVTGPESKLLYYELRDDFKEEEITYKNNRRILIKAMQEAGFHPYLEEYWHWSYAADLIELTKRS